MYLYLIFCVLSVCVPHVCPVPTEVQFQMVVRYHMGAGIRIWVIVLVLRNSLGYIFIFSVSYLYLTFSKSMLTIWAFFCRNHSAELHSGCPSKWFALQHVNQKCWDSKGKASQRDASRGGPKARREQPRSRGNCYLGIQAAVWPEMLLTMSSQL